jgi:hypothetical protein
MVQPELALNRNEFQQQDNHSQSDVILNFYNHNPNALSFRQRRRLLQFDQRNDIDQQSEEDELEELQIINNNPNSAMQNNKQSQLSNFKKKPNENQNLQ